MRKVATEVGLRKDMNAAMHVSHDLVLRNSDEVRVHVCEVDIVPRLIRGGIIAVEGLDNRREDSYLIVASSARQRFGSTA